MAIALIDANSFYCSAELLFQPWLRDKPVVVASANDGCVVSRNDPAKALGIEMGQPVLGFGEQRNIKPYHLRSVPSSQASISTKQLRMSASWLISISRSCTVLSSSSPLRYGMVSS